jgi:hypothetical protein
MKYQYDYKVKLNWQDSSTVEGSDKNDAYKRAYGLIKYAIKHDILDVKDLLDVEITKFIPEKRYTNCKYCGTSIIHDNKGRPKKYCNASHKNMYNFKKKKGGNKNVNETN